MDMILHSRACPSCAREAVALKAAVSLYRMPDLASSADIVPRVAALLPFSPAPRRMVSMRDWLVAGFVIVASVALIPLMGEFNALKAAYGSGFTFPMSLALGSFVTLYAGVFVMSHLDEFSCRLKQRGSAPRRRTA
jgi:hypothetical protein